MKKQKRRSTYSTVADILIVLMIAALYFSTNGGIKSVSASNEVFRPQPVYSGINSEKTALLIAVDYNAASIADMLDIFSQEGVNITFAVSGYWARDNAKLLKRMVNEGHEIAVMGNEPAHDGNLEWVTSDVESSLDTVELITGIRPQLYYSGEHRSVPVSTYASKNLGVTQIMCSADILSAKGGSEDIANRVKNLSAASSIILAQPTKAMCGSLCDVIEILSSKGLSVTTVSDIM